MITARLLNSTISVDESGANPQVCVNVTQGVVESSAQIRYYTSPGSARASRKFSIKFLNHNINIHGAN